MSWMKTGEEQRVSRDYNIFLADWGKACLLCIKHMLSVSCQAFHPSYVSGLLGGAERGGPPHAVTEMVIPGRCAHFC